MGTALLEQLSADTAGNFRERRGQLDLILDRVFSQAAQEGAGVTLVVCRLDTPAALGLEAGIETAEIVDKALQGLFAEIASEDWYYAPNWQRGCLAVVADKKPRAVRKEILYLHETWIRLRREIAPSNEEHAAISWGVASFPGDGADRISVVRAAEMSLFTARRDGGNSIGGRAPVEMTSIQIDLPSVQRERLQVVANRIGMDLNELVLEGIDRTLRSYEM